MTGPVDAWAAAFAKPSKLWQPAPSWKPYEWTALSVALGRIGDSFAGDIELAEIDLHQELVGGRVKSALRYLLIDGTKELRLFLQPKFWSQLKIVVTGATELLVEGSVEGRPLEMVRGFFVRTADLNEHYSGVSTTRPPDVVQPSPRRRGPATTKDWHSIAGEIARRCIDPKTGRVRVPKNESALARSVNQWLEDRDLGQTAESDMREAVKRICAALRTVQK